MVRKNRASTSPMAKKFMSTAVAVVLNGEEGIINSEGEERGSCEKKIRLGKRAGKGTACFVLGAVMRM
jgi:hypothetical protein